MNYLPQISSSIERKSKLKNAESASSLLKLDEYNEPVKLRNATIEPPSPRESSEEKKHFF